MKCYFEIHLNALVIAKTLNIMVTSKTLNMPVTSKTLNAQVLYMTFLHDFTVYIILALPFKLTLYEGNNVHNS